MNDARHNFRRRADRMSAQPPADHLSKGNIMNSLSKPAYRLKAALLACAAGAALTASPAFAQDIDAGRLLDLMVQRGLVTAEEAAQLRAEAAASPTPARAPVPQAGVAADGTQTVTYVSPVVREQIVEQVRAELGTQAQAEGWSRPGETPEWTRRVQLYGDVRMRGEGRFYDDGNADIFADYGAINAGPGQNINDQTPGYISPPFLNSLEDRQRFRVRARLGVRAQIDDWISADIRLATGSSNSPVSTNQTMGQDGTGKYHIWLDRAALRLTPVEGVAIDFGRFANPFWTSDLVYDNDMNFDGLAISGNAPVGERFSVFGSAGAFPVFNTDLNFGSRNAPTAPETGEDTYPGLRGPYPSQDRYLFAAQAGFDFKPTDRINVRLAGAYFHYDNVQGKVSAPCYYYEVTCSTDATRPAFQQFGNTMFPIRNVIPDPLNIPQSPENQYFGLASDYRMLNIRGAVDYRASDRFAVRLEGDFVKNLAFDRDLLRGTYTEADGWSGRAVNNLGPAIRVPDPLNPGNTIWQDGAFEGGDIGWSARLTVGSVLNLNWYGDWVAQTGDWNAFIGYRRLESDAVIDAFADSDMHIGGTNNRGWTIGGNYAIGRNTIFGARWLSAEEVAGAPFSVDRVFVDIMTRF